LFHHEAVAQLQGARLWRAQLQGADLGEASIFLMETNADTNLSLADLRDVVSETLAPEARAALKAELEQAIPDPETRASLLRRPLGPILSDRPPAWEPEILPKDQRRDVLTSEGAPEPVRALMGGEALVSPRDDETYGKMLAAELAQLACGLGDGQIVSRFVFRFRFQMNGAGLSDFAHHLTARCSDLTGELDAVAREALTNTSAKAADTGHP
jgi:hypothetical protein